MANEKVYTGEIADIWVLLSSSTNGTGTYSDPYQMSQIAAAVTSDDTIIGIKDEVFNITGNFTFVATGQRVYWMSETLHGVEITNSVGNHDVIFSCDSGVDQDIGGIYFHDFEGTGQNRVLTCNGIGSGTSTTRDCRFHNITGADPALGSRTTASTNNYQQCTFSNITGTYIIDIFGNTRSLSNCSFSGCNPVSGIFSVAGGGNNTSLFRCSLKFDNTETLGGGTIINESGTVYQNVSGKTQSNILFVDTENGNFDMLPNSEAITSARLLNYEDGDNSVKWLHPGHGGSDVGTFENPYASISSWHTAVQAGSAPVTVVPPGFHSVTGGTNFDFTNGEDFTLIGQDPEDRPLLLNNHTNYFRLNTNSASVTFENLEFKRFGINNNALFAVSVDDSTLTLQDLTITIGSKQNNGVCHMGGSFSTLNVTGCDFFAPFTNATSTVAWFLNGSSNAKGNIKNNSVWVNPDAGWGVGDVRICRSVECDSFTGNLVGGLPSTVPDMTAGAVASNNYFLNGSGTLTGITHVDSIGFIDPENRNLDLLPTNQIINNSVGANNVNETDTSVTIDGVTFNTIKWIDMTDGGSSNTGTYDEPYNAVATIETASSPGGICFVFKNATHTGIDTMNVSSTSGKLAFVAQTDLQVIVEDIARWTLSQSEDTLLYGINFNNLDTVSSNSYALYPGNSTAVIRAYNCLFDGTNTKTSSWMWAGKHKMINCIFDGRLSANWGFFGSVSSVGEWSRCIFQFNDSFSGNISVSSVTGTMTNCLIRKTTTTNITGMTVTNSYIEDKKAGASISGLTEVDFLGFVDPDNGNFDLLPNSPAITNVS